MSKKTKQYAYEWLLVALASIFNAISTYTFVYSNKFAPGGAAGVVNMINHFIGNDYSGILLFAINVPLLILGFIYLSRDFAIKTAGHIVISSVFLFILSAIDSPQFVAQSQIVMGDQSVIVDDTGKALIAAVVAGVMMGVTVALMFMAGGSTGGSDIPSAMMQRKNEFISVSWMIFIVNAVIIACSCVVYSFNTDTMQFSLSIENTLMPAFMAMTHLICASFTSDKILTGGKTALKFEVVTQHPQELGKDLIETLKHGVTLIPAEGMYSGSKFHVLICVVSKRELTDFKRVLAKYPDTFSYRSTVNEVYGKFRKYKADDVTE